MAMYGRDNRYRLLRRKTGTTDDADWAALQFTTASGGNGGSVALSDVTPLTTVVADLNPAGHVAAHLIEVLLRWVDTTPAPDIIDLSDRGTVNVQCVKLMPYKPPSTGLASTINIVETIAVDTAAVAAVAYRPIIIDEVWPGDRWTIRLSTIVPSSGAEDCEVLYRYLVGG